MIPLPSNWKLYGAGALLISAAYSGWQIRDWQCEAAQAKASQVVIRQTEKAGAVINAAASTYETQRQDIRHATDHDRLVIRTVFRNVPVPTSCAAPDDVVSLLDGAVSRANAAATGKPVSDVSSVAAPAPTAR